MQMNYMNYAAVINASLPLSSNVQYRTIRAVHISCLLRTPVYCFRSRRMQIRVNEERGLCDFPRILTWCEQPYKQQWKRCSRSFSCYVAVCHKKKTNFIWALFQHCLLVLLQSCVLFVYLKMAFPMLFCCMLWWQFSVNQQYSAVSLAPPFWYHTSVVEGSQKVL